MAALTGRSAAVQAPAPQTLRCGCRRRLPFYVSCTGKAHAEAVGHEPMLTALALA